MNQENEKSSIWMDEINKFIQKAEAGGAPEETQGWLHSRRKYMAMAFLEAEKYYEGLFEQEPVPNGYILRERAEREMRALKTKLLKFLELTNRLSNAPKWDIRIAIDVVLYNTPASEVVSLAQ